MQTPRANASLLATSLALCTVGALFVTGCKPKEKDAADDTAASAEAGAADAEAGESTESGEAGTTDAAEGSTGAAEATDTGGEASDTGTGGAGEPGTGGADAGEDTAGEDAGDDAADAGETAEADPVKPLLDEVTNKRTKDDRAMAALDEAKQAGAEVGDLAAAANKRGTRLFTSPDRAKKFFEYARDIDPKYPDASFNLAKLAANTGDVGEVKELLAETKARGGKKLLKTVGFDPTFALVADDPDVVALTK